MDLSTKSKKQLKALVAHLEIDVEAKKKNKPTMDELVVALEGIEDEVLEEAFKELGFEDGEEEVDDDDLEEDEGEVEESQVYTYVGKGESSPQRIKFLGRQEFVRGRPVKVTDPMVLKKIKGVPTFVRGSASVADLIQDIEDEGLALADKNRKVDAQMDANFKKQHSGSSKEA